VVPVGFEHPRFRGPATLIGMPSDIEKAAMKAREEMRRRRDWELEALKVEELANPSTGFPLPSHIDVERMDDFLKARRGEEEAIQAYEEAKRRD
jgi:hypothetical protein